jgi:hypothetical protein
MEVRVEKHRILGTRFVVYTAYAPTTLMGPYSSLHSFEGAWMGQLGTERDLPPELEALSPMTTTRIEAVHSWQQANAARAHAFIIAAHPEAALGAKRFNGQIELEA